MDNLLKIGQLKERIQSQEAKKDLIAQQNNELREGALAGIEMAKNLDELSREREILTIDIADKAIVIRKLLEDNSILQ